MTTETKTQIDEILSREMVTFSVRLMGPMMRDSWECDAWVFTLAGKTTYSGNYYTGSGLRKLSKHAERANRSSGYAKAKPEPVAPCAADVLHSLILDSSATDMSFNDWCKELGFNNDSIKDLTTYQDCCKEGEELRKVFSRATMAEMALTLQDY
jgi:hypothetical protein